MLQLIPKYAVAAFRVVLTGFAAVAICGILVQRISRLSIWKLSRSRLVVLGLMAIAATFAAQKVRYVNASATGRGTGDDWENAYTDLTDITARINPRAGAIIYVRPGHYGPIWWDTDVYFTEGSVSQLHVIATEGPEFMRGGQLKTAVSRSRSTMPQERLPETLDLSMWPWETTV